jgi:cellulose synthase (UDP-forming)
VRGIGGFQPTRAEDHLDTVALAAAGHTGVYVPEIIATGEGPADFGTYLGQQFAWAYSMVQIFLQHTPRLVRRYTAAQTFQFLMAQGWYTLWSLSLAVLWVLPVVALLSGRPIANVPLLEYLAYNLAVVLTATLMWRWSRRWFQPPGIGLTWRGVVLEIARWPIVLWAAVNAALRVKRPYMITPKGTRTGAPPPGARLYGPPILLAELALGAVAVFQAGGGHAATQGYLALVLFNLVMVVMLLVTALALELRDLSRRTGRLGTVLRWRAGSVLAVAAIATSTVAATVACWAPLMEAIR